MDRVWYISTGGESRGPLTIREVGKLFWQKQLSKDSPVWRQGFDDWQPLKNVMKAFQEVTKSEDPQALFANTLRLHERTYSERIMAVEDDENYRHCARAIKDCKSLIVTAGAGMGVDSGLPDFRSAAGLWKDHPQSQRVGISFIDAANPYQFREDPHFSWGFYGDRLQAYRQTDPHDGFRIILQWIERYQLDYFVVTSNVDEQFQKAGFASDRVYEKHGSIHALQCLQPCSEHIWRNQQQIQVDPATMRATDILRCLHCQDIARPNILMFGDFTWIPRNSTEQQQRFARFKDNYRPPLVVLEIGAGTTIASIRRISEDLGELPQTRVFRINVAEPQIHQPHIPLRGRALEILTRINHSLH